MKKRVEKRRGGAPRREKFYGRQESIFFPEMIWVMDVRRKIKIMLTTFLNYAKYSAKRDREVKKSSFKEVMRDSRSP